MSLISRFTRLVNLHLDGYVEGFAANNLTPLCRLEDLRMRGTSVVGDLAFVKNLNTLRDLELTGSVFMGGNLQALEHNANLETLMLSKVDMNIDDNVKSLRSLVRLQRLDLSYTCVIGSLSFARNLTLLNALSLESTNVEGNMSTLQRLVLLTHLDLDYTQVHMCERVRACLRPCDKNLGVMRSRERGDAVRGPMDRVLVLAVGRGTQSMLPRGFLSPNGSISDITS